MALCDADGVAKAYWLCVYPEKEFANKLVFCNHHFVEYEGKLRRLWNCYRIED